MTPPGQWSIISGVFSLYFDYTLCEHGRARYCGLENNEAPTRSGLELDQRLLFGAVKTPWRIASVNLLTDEHPAVRSWADELAPPGATDFIDLRPLLDPSPLATVLDLSPGGSHFVRRAALEDDLFLAPGLVVLGADYEAEVDETLGILKSWKAWIADSPAAEFVIQPNWWE
jgi:hypothetical protein